MAGKHRLTPREILGESNRGRVLTPEEILADEFLTAEEILSDVVEEGETARAQPEPATDGGRSGRRTAEITGERGSRAPDRRWEWIGSRTVEPRE